MQTAIATDSRRTPRRRVTGQAPISAALRAQLQRDCASIQAIKDAARRHGDAELETYEAKREYDTARQNFDLGCWLAYYAPRLREPAALQDRIECAVKLLRAGITDPGYDFYTVFRFGERDYDTIFEMGDADQVVAALFERAALDNELAAGLEKSGIRRRD